MAIDASVYSQFQPVDFASSLQKGLQMKQEKQTLSDMALQRQKQQTLESAYAKNISPDGTLNRQGLLSDLANAGMGSEAFQAKNTLDTQDAATQQKKYDLFQRQMNVVGGAMEGLSKLPQDQRASLYPQMRQQFVEKGLVDPKDSPEQYDNHWFNSWMGQYHQTKDYMDRQLTNSQINKNNAEAGEAPIKKNAELYGSRSPNAELTSQYDKQAAPIRGSQMAMQQMLDNYKNPSPQGDASLILNAFKIKFPNAPDVNSLEELSKSQAVPDQWKQKAAHALSGGLDQGTRDNLMRDAASTFNANVTSLRGVQQKYQARAKQQNVNDPTLTQEPAVDSTFSELNDLRDKIGPYVPPAERGGITGELASLASKLMGSGDAGKQAAGQSGGPAQVAKGGSDSSLIKSANAGNGSQKIDAQDAQALQWLKSADPSDPMSFQVRAKLKRKGLL